MIQMELHRPMFSCTCFKHFLILMDGSFVRHIFLQVSEGTSHIGIGGFAFNALNLPGIQVDITLSLYSSDAILLATSPQPLKPFWNILKPFSREVWLILSITVFMVIVVLFIILAVDRSILYKKESMSNLVLASCSISLASLLGQGSVLLSLFHFCISARTSVKGTHVMSMITLIHISNPLHRLCEKSTQAKIIGSFLILLARWLNMDS